MHSCCCAVSEACGEGNMEKTTTTNGKVGKKICKICGDVATAFNHCGLTCETCKIFFRRSHNKNLKCRFGGNCQIDTVLTRKACAACRLAKCFSIGMRMKSSKASAIENGTSENIRKILESGLEDDSSETICECHLKRLQVSARRKTLKLSGYEQQLIDDVASAMAVFPDESSLPICGTVTDFNYTFNLPGNYATRIVKFCKKFEAFKCLPQEDQFVILKAFYFEFCYVWFSFYMDEKLECSRMIETEAATRVILVPFHLYEQSNFKSHATVNKRIMGNLHKKMKNNTTVRDLLIAQFLFKPRENVSTPELLNYHHSLYRRLIQRYLEEQFNSITVAKSKYVGLMKQISEQKLKVVRTNLIKVLKTTELVNPLGLLMKEVFNVE